MMKSILSVAGIFAATAAAYTPPGANTYGALLTPNGDNPVITGQTTQITWSPKSPTDGVTVSLVLCNGPSTNCVRQSAAIVEGVPASAASYAWNVPCDFPTGTANTASGYGMLIIVDGTGEFQYSTQFSVVQGSSCGASGSSTSSSSLSTSTSTSRASSSTTSASVSSSASATYTDHGSSWMQWSSSTTFNTSTIASTAVTAVSVSTSKFSYAPAATTSAASVSYAYPTSSQTSAVVTQATATTARPSAFTGAAVAPVVNVLGLMGAAGLAVLAL